MIQKLLDIPMPCEAASPTPTARLTAEHITRLAATCAKADQPIWVHDLEARCLYRNPPAERTPDHRESLMIFDIVDYRDRSVGYLATSAES